MTQIINIANFLMELIFGRQPSRQTGKKTIGFLLVTVLLAASLGAHVLMFKELFDVTAKNMEYRREIARVASFEDDLKQCTASYGTLLALLRNKDEDGAREFVTPLETKPLPPPRKNSPRQNKSYFPGPEGPRHPRNQTSPSEPAGAGK